MCWAIFLFMKWVYFPELEFLNKICFTILVIREHWNILENRVVNIKSIFESIHHKFCVELEWLLNLRCSWSSSLIRISFCEIPAKSLLSNYYLLWFHFVVYCNEINLNCRQRDLIEITDYVLSYVKRRQPFFIPVYLVVRSQKLNIEQPKLKVED